MDIAITQCQTAAADTCGDLTTGRLGGTVALAVTSQLDADTGKGTDTHGGAFTLLECADVSKTTIRAASIWQSHSVRPQTLAVTSPLDADTRKGTYTQARDWFLRTTPSALPGRQNCAVDQYLHLFFFKLAHFLSQLEVTCMRRKLSAANQQSEPHGFGNHTVSDHKHYPRPRRWTLGAALSATSQMDAWPALSATSQMDAGALSATSQMDADTRNGRHTHEGACVAAHFVSNAQK